MPVFRIEKNKGYTVMSNHHLRNKELTLKAKGLLSQMLSLPDNWDFTLAGLSHINRESIGAIRTAIWELEEAGYITRHQGRDSSGKMTAIEYTIYEQPHPIPPESENPIPGSPLLDFPTSDEPTSKIPMELNKDVLNKDLSNKDLSITDQSIKDSFLHSDGQMTVEQTDRRTDSLRDKIKKQIDYELIVTPRTRAQVDEFVELILEVFVTKSKTIKFGRELIYPTEFVQERFSKLDVTHIEKVLEGIDVNKTRVKNTKAYLTTALFNAPASIDNHYTMQVNHDLNNSS